MVSAVAVKMRMQRLFFDRARVLKKIGKRKARALNRGGFFIRQAARKLLGPPSKKAYPRPPGKPPRVRTSDERVSLRNIQYHYDGKDSVIIGPVKLNQQNQNAVDLGNITVPELHEKGGTVDIREVSVNDGKTWWRRDLRRNQREWEIYRTRRAEYPARPTMEPALKNVAKAGKVPYLFARTSVGD